MKWICIEFMEIRLHLGKCFHFSKTETNQGIGAIMSKLKSISLNIHFFVNVLFEIFQDFILFLTNLFIRKIFSSICVIYISFTFSKEFERKSVWNNFFELILLQIYYTLSKVFLVLLNIYLWLKDQTNENRW